MKATRMNKDNPATPKPIQGTLKAGDKLSIADIERVKTVYANLIQAQEPLGTECERVLFDNLWELYER
jgi:hypothetical protein